jgi:hypothetical protein
MHDSSDQQFSALGGVNNDKQALCAWLPLSIAVDDQFVKARDEIFPR